MNRPEPPSQTNDSYRKRLVFIVFGYLFFAVGLLGTVLPVLPTTGFWIIAAICFARSSPKMYQRILTWPHVGAAVDDFITYGVISRRGKALAVGGMTAAAIIVALTSLGTVEMLLTFALIAVGAIYVLTRPSHAVGKISQ